MSVVSVLVFSRRRIETRVGLFVKKACMFLRRLSQSPDKLWKSWLWVPRRVSSADKSMQCFKKSLFVKSMKLNQFYWKILKFLEKKWRRLTMVDFFCKNWDRSRVQDYRHNILELIDLKRFTLCFRLKFFGNFRIFLIKIQFCRLKLFWDQDDN